QTEERSDLRHARARSTPSPDGRGALPARAPVLGIQSPRLPLMADLRGLAGVRRPSAPSHFPAQDRDRARVEAAAPAREVERGVPARGRRYLPLRPLPRAV